MSNSIIGIIIVVVSLIVFLGFMASRYKKVKNEGEAIVVNGLKKSIASFTGAFVWPVINNYQYIDITRKNIPVLRIGKKDGDDEETEGLHCKDNIRADMKVDFYIGVNHELESVKQVAKTFNKGDTYDIVALTKHFSPKFSEALKTTCKKFDFEELFEKRAEFRDAVMEVIGEEMDGFKIYDVVIDKLEQTSLEAHNKDNILDSEGIRKIAQMTAQRNVETNAIRQDEETNITEKNVSAIQQRLQLEKEQKRAEATQKREIAIIEANEHAETTEKEQEYKLKEEVAKIKTAEESEKRLEQKSMEVEVTRLNNEKKIRIQKEEIERADELEKVKTQKIVVEENVKKDLALETGKKEVADVTSQRVEIERKIATEEEKTADLRAFQSAERSKKVKVTEAEAEAEASQVEEIKRAEAQKLAATENAERDKTVADAELYKKSKEAESIGIISEAKQKEIAASGLAEVEVEARRAEVIEKVGKAKATEIREVGEAKAIEIREVGKATAEAKEAELKAAESGNEESREYNKWLRNKDIEEKVALRRIEVDGEVSVQGAKALGEALSKADMKLYGGEGVDSIRRAINSSAKIDAGVQNSELLVKELARFENDENGLIKELFEVLKKSDVSTGDITNLSLAQLMTKHPDIVKNLTDKLSAK